MYLQEYLAVLICVILQGGRDDFIASTVSGVRTPHHVYLFEEERKTFLSLGVNGDLFCSPVKISLHPVSSSSLLSSALPVKLIIDALLFDIFSSSDFFLSVFPLFLLLALRKDLSAETKLHRPSSPLSLSLFPHSLSLLPLLSLSLLPLLSLSHLPLLSSLCLFFLSI